MAGEYRRKRGRKIVRLPSGQSVPVPVITSISFIDPRDRYQETVYSVNNTAEASRVVHVDAVLNSRNPAADPLYVERIDTWKTIDPVSRYQETHVSFDNVTGGDSVPPSFTTHRQRHIFRYYADPNNPDDDGAWIDSELIDEFATLDARDRYQETIHTLNNPANGDAAGQADSADPDITIGGEEGTAGNPVRLDPFQNIVGFSDLSMEEPTGGGSPGVGLITLSAGGGGTSSYVWSTIAGIAPGDNGILFFDMINGTFQFSSTNGYYTPTFAPAFNTTSPNTGSRGHFTYTMGGGLSLTFTTSDDDTGVSSTSNQDFTGLTWTSNADPTKTWTAISFDGPFGSGASQSFNIWLAPNF